MPSITREEGSSPLARGTRRTRCGAVHADGLIPACAGNIWSLRRDRNSSAAHPRSRGEHQRAPRLRRPFHGSSPLARGTRFRLSLRTVNERLIPARAGNTVIAAASITSFSAHPRSRGEHRYASATERWPLGSSPLARGTLSKRVQRRDRLGLIPACAGNMALWFLLRCVPAAHPRSRGEHVVQQRRADNAVGSSLLARGTQLSLHQHCLHVGLIPACAGNTLWRNCWAPARAAHPCSRGEHPC